MGNKLANLFNNIKKGKVSTKAASSVTVNTGATLPPTTYLVTGSPVWRNMSEMIYLLNCYNENPIVQAIVNIKADAQSNMMFNVRDLKTGEIIPLEEYEADQGSLKRLLKKPNPLQSTYEWIRQFKINQEVFGNGYAYASVPVGFEKSFSYKDIAVINNLHPYLITPVLTGNWLEATTKEEIINRYEYKGINGKTIPISTNKVLHCNNSNIVMDAKFTEGRSKLIALTRPISNIDMAYESRNVLIKKRGALGAWTPDRGTDEATGSGVPMQEGEIEDTQKAFEKYGLLDDQYTQIISPYPLKWQKTALSVKDLMLFEEVEADAIAIANSLGVPEMLVKYYLKGGTFNNLDASEKRLYDSTIIPETKDFMVSLNNFLKCEENGIELLGSFDHVNVLQGDKKEEAQTENYKQKTALDAFRIGAIKYNEYLLRIGMEEDPEIGDKRIWDLDERQLNAIGIKEEQNGQGNGNQAIEGETEQGAA